MPVKFTPDCPAGLVIQEILAENKDGLKIPQIRGELLKRGIRGLGEKDIKELLDHPDVFTSSPNGTYQLKSYAVAGTFDEQQEEESKEKKPKEKVRSTFTDIPLLNTLVFFDLETTGLDSKRDEIIQIAALKVKADGEIEPRNWYVKPTKKIPYTLKLKLNFDKFPEIEDMIMDAPRIEQVIEEFSEFIEDLPLVAHNGDFDYSFLKEVMSDIDNKLIDSLELACLVCPQLESHRLEVVAEHFGYSKEGYRKEEIPKLADKLELSQKFDIAFSWEGYHNALIDCLVLYKVFYQLVEEAKKIDEKLKKEFIRVAPHLKRIFGDVEPNDKRPESLSDIFTLYIPEERTPLPPALDFSKEKVFEEFDKYLSEKNFEKREAQREMLSAVVDSFQKEQTMMIEAPTGTGKTLAYLLPAILFSRATGEKVAVSTHVKSLQSQLVRDLKDLQENLSISFRFQQLKGVTNYICLRDLFFSYLDLLDQEKVDFDELLCFFYLFSYTAKDQGGSFDELSYWFENSFPEFREIKSKISADYESCTKEKCDYYDQCFLYKARRLAREADILVLNHALLLSKDWEKEDVPKFHRLIIDEAHNIEDVATSVLTEEVSRDSLEQIFLSLRSKKKSRGLLVRIQAQSPKKPCVDAIRQVFASLNHARKISEEFGSYLAKYLKSLNLKLHPRYGASLRLEADPNKISKLKWEQVEAQKRQLIFALTDLTSSLDTLGQALIKNPVPKFNQEYLNEIGFIVKKLEESVETFLDILKVNFDPSRMVHWIEVCEENSEESDDSEEKKPGKINWAVKRAPVRVDRTLREKVYFDKKTLVLTSATLTTASEGFGFFIDRLGFSEFAKDDSLIKLNPVLDYKNALLGLINYLDFSASYRELDKFKEQVAKELEYFFKFTDGKGLVLYAARNRMEFAANILEDRLGEVSIPLYWQEAGRSKRALREEFEQRKESVLLGLKSFWEGIDVHGSSLSYVLMEKLPFPHLFDPVIKSRCEQVKMSGKSEFSDYILPLTIVQFKQGFGRLLRKKEDVGVVILLDKRVRRAEYQYEVLESLPDYIRYKENELSREDFYRKIAEHMKKSEDAEIDLAEKEDFLASLPEEILIDLEERLKEYELPKVLTKEEFSEYRDKILEAMEVLFEFPTFKVPEQEEVIKAILTGENVLAVLPTGSGKSFCYQFPAVLREGVTLVFSPLIALMKDQVDSMKEKGLSIVDYIVSGQRASEREEIYEKMRNGRTRLVYISPERIRDPMLIQVIEETEVIQIVVDEAHCIHMWGHSFRPDFLYLKKLFKERWGKIPIAAFTATATEEVRNSIAENLKLDDYQFITRSIDREELTFVVYNEKSAGERIGSKNDKFRVLTKIMRACDSRGESAIVYTSTIRAAEMVAKKLSVSGFSARSYHGKMNAHQRRDVQEMFMENMINIVVATKAFGMGIDKEDVRYIIHYNLPSDIESYYQEAGRAGRDGKRAYCVLLYHPSDINVQEYFIDNSVPEEYILENVLEYFRNEKGNLFFVDPKHICDKTGVSEERIDFILHLLEQEGFIKRKHDFTLNAKILLLKSTEEIMEELEDKEALLFSSIVKAADITARTSKSVNLLEIYKKTGETPLLVDKLLIKLSLSELITYRAWERGFIISSTEKLRSEEQFKYKGRKSADFLKRQRKKLKKMIRYAKGLKRGECRREEILRYFGEEKERHDKEYCCDLCNPTLSLPWSRIPEQEVVEVTDYIDPAYTVLRAIEWNVSLEDEEYRAPYGAGTLMYILTGNSYKVLEYEKDPKKRKRKWHQVESSPYFGLLANLSKAKDKVSEIYERLEKEEFIEYKEKSIPEKNISYNYPILQSKGEDKILEGRYLGW